MSQMEVSEDGRWLFCVGVADESVVQFEIRHEA